jgi:hypothetical protein
VGGSVRGGVYGGRGRKEEEVRGELRVGEEGTDTEVMGADEAGDVPGMKLVPAECARVSSTVAPPPAFNPPRAAALLAVDMLLSRRAWRGGVLLCGGVAMRLASVCCCSCS